MNGGRSSLPQIASAIYWLSFILCVAGLGVGRAWDAYWHATQPFDTFWSPPHIFAYGTTAISFLLCLVLFASSLRTYFEKPASFENSNARLVNPLYLIVAGYLMLLFAGLVLDFGWHSTFGLNETSWSFPHSLIVWSWLVVLLAFTACYLNLRFHIHFSDFAIVLFGVLIIGFSAAPMLGPFYHNFSQETVQTVAALPALSAQSSAQQVFQLYLSLNLTRTHPLVTILGAFWCGSALGLIGQIDQRARVLLSSAFLWSVVASIGDLNSIRWLQHVNLAGSTTWLSLPALPAAIMFIGLRRLSVGTNWAWCAAGVTFGMLTLLFWTEPLGSPIWAVPFVVLAGPSLLFGSRLGASVATAITILSKQHIQRLMAGTLMISAALGVIDLALRLST